MWAASDLLPYVTNRKIVGVIDMFLKIGAKLGGKPPVAILVALSLVAPLSGCAHLKAAALDFAQCEKGQVPAQAQEVLVDVEAALFSGANWKATLEGLGLKVGTDVVTCAVAAIKAQLSGSIPAGAQPDPAVERAVARAGEYLRTPHAAR
jgi:hypothetical protein